MQLAVKAAGIADSLAISRPSPQGCRVGLAVGTSLPIPLGCGLQRREKLVIRGGRQRRMRCKKTIN